MKSPISELDADTKTLAELVATHFEKVNTSPLVSIQRLRDVADNIEKAYKQWVKP